MRSLIRKSSWDLGHYILHYDCRIIEQGANALCCPPPWPRLKRTYRMKDIMGIEMISAKCYFHRYDYQYDEVNFS